MIVIFPALCSSTVDKKVLPGIAKTLELYAITYLLQDTIQRETNKKVSINKSTKRLLIEQTLVGQNPKTGAPTTSDTSFKSGSSAGRPPRPQKPAAMPPRPGDNQVKIDKPWSSDINLPPTWVKVDTPTGTQIVGVKVLPFIVKSDKEFTSLLGEDLEKLSWFKSFGKKLFRQIVGIFLRTFKRKGISGDVKNDVIYARSNFGKNVFCIYDYAAVQNITADPSKIRKLFKFYWSSIIFCDDANNIAYFCMKHFSGICNTIPYNFLFSISREASKVYEDLSAATSSASSIFKRKRSHLTKILGENYAAQLVYKMASKILEK